MVDDIRDSERLGPSTYLTEAEAREFHGLFMVSFVIFTLVAIVAHFLVWTWRPWLPGEQGYAPAAATTAVVAAPTTQS